MLSSKNATGDIIALTLHQLHNGARQQPDPFTFPSHLSWTEPSVSTIIIAAFIRGVVAGRPTIRLAPLFRKPATSQGSKSCTLRFTVLVTTSFAFKRRFNMTFHFRPSPSESESSPPLYPKHSTPCLLLFIYESYFTSIQARHPSREKIST